MYLFVPTRAVLYKLTSRLARGERAQSLPNVRSRSPKPTSYAKCMYYVSGKVYQWFRLYNYVVCARVYVCVECPVRVVVNFSKYIIVYSVRFTYYNPLF